MKRKRTGTFAIIAAATVVAVVFVSCRQVAVEAAYPIERARASFSRRAWTRIKGAFRGADAAVEAARLRREVAALAVLRNDIDSLEAENDRLRRTLDYAERTKSEWIAAEVLSRGGGAAGAGRRIRVSKGALAGVSEGAAVVVPDGLVGIVTGVTPHTAEITLISDSRVKVACEVEVSDGASPRGILVGGTDDILVLKYMSRTEKAAPRARVLTSGLGGVFPRGLEVGTLLNVRTDERGLVCEGEVLPSVDCSSLEDVFIRREE